MDPPTIYLPAETVDNVRQLLQAWQRLDRGRMDCEPSASSPETRSSSRASTSSRRSPRSTRFPRSGTWCGTAARSCDPKSTACREQIRDLRLAGRRGRAEIRMPIVCYIGDTAPAGLDGYPASIGPRY